MLELLGFISYVITLYVFVPPAPVDLEENEDRRRAETGEWRVPVVLDFHGGGFTYVHHVRYLCKYAYIYLGWRHPDDTTTPLPSLQGSLMLVCSPTNTDYRLRLPSLLRS